MRCLEKVLPRMSNAVVKTSSSESPFKQAVFPTDYLQFLSLPDNNQPLWLPLKRIEDLPRKQPLQAKAATLCTNDATLSKLRDAHIGPQLREEEIMAVQHVWHQHVDLFASGDNDLGFTKGQNTPYSLCRVHRHMPLNHGKKDRDFMERLCQVFHAPSLVTKTAQLEQGLYQTASQLLHARE
ncbi:hypothetical protein HPB51_008410 [Rhipicephalus microplus]|uniref:Uncharacterized protein n=1 Tax=Rhipicephalus microplus TaxID=6941 RepID=A0A9J6DFX7_RHIMP|nr:hypothetical protein HPB51_008410 [Rhipicephalus microplus]